MVNLIALVLVSILWTSNVHSAQIIKGNQQHQDQFSFNLGQHAFADSSGIFVVGAQDPVHNNEFSVALATRSDSFFTGLTPPMVTLNDQKDQPNPLTGKGIAELTLFESKPVVVNTGQPNRVYFFEHHGKVNEQHVATHVKMISSERINDTEGKPSDGIIGLTTLKERPVIFAAVKPHQGFFGQLGSGIATLMLHEPKKAGDQNNDKKSATTLSIKNPENGKLDENKIAPLSVESAAIKIHAPAAAIFNEQVKLQWVPAINHLYIPLQVQAGAAADDGVRGLVLGTFENDKLSFKKIIPDTAVGQDSIIAAKGSSAQVSLFFCRPLETTTGLVYLIVVGGVGQPDDVKNKIFALPLVNGVDDVKNQKAQHAVGMIAKKGQVPTNNFSPIHPHILISRSFNTPVTTQEDMTTPFDRGAQVGGNDLPGPVTDITVRQNTVFASVTKPTNFQKPGIFYSQALFDGQGRVMKWTPWQRAAGTDSSTSIAGFAFDTSTTDFWFIPFNDRDDSKHVTSVYRTQWDKQKEKDEKNRDTALSQAVNPLFKDVPSGIQDLKVYQPNTPGLTNQLNEHLSIMVATGFNTVVLVQTGNDTSNDLFKPVTHFDKPFQSSNGTLNGFASGFKVLKIQGGQLDDIGPIVASAIVTNGHFGWLVVAGSEGVAVLADKNGHGWSVSEPNGTGLAAGFKGLSSDMRFVKIGNYKNVHKLIGQQDQLFITTPTVFDRVTINAHSITNFNHATHLAIGGDNLPTYFLDALVSEDFALLATSSGLLKIGKGQDIRTINNQSNAHWTMVDMPFSVGGVCRLFAVTPTGLENDFVNDGNLYVINSSPSNNQARIYRYVPTGTDANTRGLELFPDFFDKPAGRLYFFNLGIYRGYFMTDGAVLLFSGPTFKEGPSAISLVNQALKTGVQFMPHNLINVVDIAHSQIIGSPVREYASGSLLAWGDFGIRLNG